MDTDADWAMTGTCRRHYDSAAIGSSEAVANYRHVHPAGTTRRPCDNEKSPSIAGAPLSTLAVV